MSNLEKGFIPQYDDNKESNTIYVGKEKINAGNNNYRKVELILEQEKSYLTEKNKEKDSKKEIFELSKKDELILYASNGGQIKIHCWLIETQTAGKITTALHISRRNRKGVYGSQEVTLNISSVIALKMFLDKLFIMDTSNKYSFK